MAASEWLVISENDLDMQYARSSGGWTRAYCHIHGSDNQRSLSINEETGFGQCHNCKALVLVEEWNREAAQNIRRGAARVADGNVKVIDPKYIARAARTPKEQKPRDVKPWQREELALLRELQDSMTTRLADERARAYLAQRGISFDMALSLGVGYIPADAKLQGKYARIARWADHMIFPLQSPSDGIQYVGRSLKLWTPGMDESGHKCILEAREQELRNAARAAMARGYADEAEALEHEAGLYLRWYKTHANGWFLFQRLEDARRVVFTEGTFDALALAEVGIHAIAIIGTALESAWLPKRLEHVYLAYDGDESGIAKSKVACDELYERGYDVTVCHAPGDDGRGKDWSERYRLHGSAGLRSILDVWTAPEQETLANEAPIIVHAPDGARELMRWKDESELSLTCYVCGAEVERYAEHDGAIVAYCERHYQDMQSNRHQPSTLTREQFEQATQQLTAALAESTGANWTVTPMPPAYTLADYVKELQQERAARQQQEALPFWDRVHRDLARQGYYEQYTRDQEQEHKRIAAYERAYLPASQWTWAALESA